MFKFNTKKSEGFIRSCVYLRLTIIGLAVNQRVSQKLTSALCFVQCLRLLSLILVKLMHSTTLAYGDAQEDHAYKQADQACEDHPCRRAPGHGILVVIQRCDLDMANYAQADVDCEDERADDDRNDGQDEGYDAHGMRLEEERGEDRCEREPGRDGVEDEDGRERLVDAVDDVLVADNVNDALRDVIAEPRAVALDEAWQRAVRAEAPDTEAQVGRCGRRGVAALWRELDAEEEDVLDDWRRERDEEIEKECGEEEEAVCEGDPEVLLEGTRRVRAQLLEALDAARVDELLKSFLNNSHGSVDGEAKSREVCAG